MTVEKNHSWQSWMQNALILPAQAKQADIEEMFTAGAHLTPAQCLAIYQNGYILRLTKCLAEQFPALCHALGEPLFNQFARKYLQVYPSESYTLYELGRRFCGFLQQDRPDKDLPPEQRESWIDFMVDLADYERRHFNMFDAPGHEGQPWPTAQVADSELKLQPCFELLQYRYPVAWYYHEIKDNPDTPFPPRQDHYLVLLRKDYQVTTYPINPVHFYFLQQLQQQQNIPQALQAVSEMTEVSLAQVTDSWQQEVRTRWLDAGFFV